MDEYLDIVDENDEVIGRDTRDTVHAGHHIHRGAHVLVINGAGELLVQKRSKNKDYYPGVYDASVGAQVSSGETYEEAAHREAYEELGVELGELVEITRYKSFSDRQREFRQLFITQHEGPFTVDEKEVERVEFMSIERLEQVIVQDKSQLTEGFVISLIHYKQYLTQVNPS